MTLTKPADRAALMRDSEYFATELIARMERLARLEPERHAVSWRQAAVLARRARQLARERLEARTGHAYRRVW